MRRALAVSLAFVVTGVAAWTIVAGPLDPPAGPVGSTFKTLSQVEPRIPIGPETTPGDANSMFRITAPGSYYLTGNITGEAGKNGILVAAQGVSIDLGGFVLGGVPGSFMGIRVDFPSSQIEVRNGAISNWGTTGVHADGTRNGLFENLRLTANDIGLRASHASVVVDCVATHNSSTGILGSASVIRGCVAYQNGSAGIYLNSGGVIDQCEASNNGEYGIVALHRATITNCSAMSNAGGIFGQNSCLIRDCTVGNNTNDGFRVHTGTLISGCVAFENATGIHVIGSATRVEDNSVTNNQTGIGVDAANNFIVRNTARGNTTANFAVIAGNEFAPVLTNPGTTFTNATPWSNFAY